MTAFNAVRFKVKAGREQCPGAPCPARRSPVRGTGRPGHFLDAHRGVGADWPGLRHANIIETGAGCYCIIAEWEDSDSLAAARPQMIATLDSFRDTLEELGEGRGLTDPVSGPVVMAMK